LEGIIGTWENDRRVAFYLTNFAALPVGMGIIDRLAESTFHMHTMEPPYPAPQDE